MDTTNDNLEYYNGSDSTSRFIHKATVLTLYFDTQGWLGWPVRNCAAVGPRFELGDDLHPEAKDCKARKPWYLW